nr:hypothetical protein [Cytophagales bacterium]
MKQVIDTLRRIFRQAADWWLVIRPARFALIILLVGAFAFTGVEPAHDVFNGIAVGSSDGSGITITYSALLVGTLLWSFTVWATVYYAYQYVNLKPRQKSLHHEAWFLKVAKWILTVLPVFPFVIAAWGFWAADAKPQAGERIMSY